MKKILRLSENDINKIVRKSLNEVSWQLADKAADKAESNDRWYKIRNAAENLIATMTEIMNGEDDDYGVVEYSKQPQLQRFIDNVQNIIDYCDRKERQISNLEHHADARYNQRFGMSRDEMDDSISNSFMNDRPLTPDQKEYYKTKY